MEHDWRRLIDQLLGADYQFGLVQPGSPVHCVEFDAGLSDSEVVTVESQFGFRFPPDLRRSADCLTLRSTVPRLRLGDEATLREWLDRPREGILFDIERNGLWLDEWVGDPGHSMRRFGLPASS